MSADHTAQTTEIARPRRPRITTPHLRVGEKFKRHDLGDALARRHRVWVAPTACGRDDVNTTLVTGFTDRVRCPDCRAAVPHLYAPVPPEEADRG